MKPIRIKKSQLSLNKLFDYLADVDCSLLTETDYYQVVVAALEYSSSSYVWTYERKVARLFTVALVTALVWMWVMSLLFFAYDAQWYSEADGVTVYDYLRCAFYSASPFALVWSVVSSALLLAWWRMS